MSLIELWRASREQIAEKHVQQIVAFAGDGKLGDGKSSSLEFRSFLTEIPSDVLTRYASECLTGAFSDSGLVLQDAVNEIGSRLGFRVTHGRYRGAAGHLGFDGLWQSSDGHSIVIEVKTTDTYRIDLNTIADYRRALVKSQNLAEDSSSILIVVGRQDTGDLEAQVRGSQHAWDIRLISTEALMSLLAVKEELEDPETQNRIHAVLRPREFTKLDEIVDLLFSTAADLRQDELVEADEEEEEPAHRHIEAKKPKFTPVSFHDACVRRIERFLDTPLVKRSRATFAGPDQSLRVICAISREHARSGTASYWFAFHPYYAEYLEGARRGYMAFGCGSAQQLLLIPYGDFSQWLEGMNETSIKGRSYKHVSISQTPQGLELVRRKGWPRIELNQYLISPAS